MSPREALIRAVFAGLEQAEIQFCISRNASAALAEDASDVDLLVEPQNLKRAYEISRTAALTAGCRLVSQTRFANLSLVFWRPGGWFLRIDFETEIRWRIWPVTRLAEILKNTVLVGGIPAAGEAAETAVLVTKTLWAGNTSERYHARLLELRKKKSSQAGLLPCFMVEHALAGRTRALRRVVVFRALVNPSQWAILTQNLLHDLFRACCRANAPPGIYLSAHVSTPLPSKRLKTLMEMAFPPAKAHWGKGEADFRKTAKSLFRGGMVVQQTVDEQATAFQKRNARNPGLWMARKSHRFNFNAPPGCRAFLGHPATGRMWPVDDSSLESDLADGIAEAMADTVERPNTGSQRGMFAVLVGLDGAGKTTFARNLCSASQEKTGFGVIRYFHWMPKWGTAEFPWTTTVEIPRKLPRSGWLASIFSIMRLGHHLFQAHWRSLLVTTPAVRQGNLVLVDRFLYNYWLDPASLKYSGPAWCLRLAAVCMPKPDLILSLEANAATILSRKSELSREEIEIQAERLRCLPMRGTRLVVIDAAQTPERIVDDALRALRSIKTGKHSSPIIL